MSEYVTAGGTRDEMKEDSSGAKRGRKEDWAYAWLVRPGSSVSYSRLVIKRRSHSRF